MRKAVLILPYFGKFNNYFNLFLRSCSYNTDFDWLIFTDDDTKYNYPENVHRIQMDFEQFKKLAQEKFDFPLALSTPYKLCDFRPAYGYLFNQWIHDYEYWGYCDCDLIFGNLNKLVTPLLSQGYDKIFAAGHLTLYRNTEYNNCRFMHSYGDFGEVYRKAFSDPDSKVFDESYFAVNIQRIFEDEHCSLYTHDLSFNVSQVWNPATRIRYSADEHRWRECCNLNELVYWYDGSLYGVRKHSGKLVRQEYAYIHLQLRRMNVQGDVVSSPAVWVTGQSFIARPSIPQSSVDFTKDLHHSLHALLTIQQLKRFKHFLHEARYKTDWPLISKEPCWEHNPYVK